MRNRNGPLAHIHEHPEIDGADLDLIEQHVGSRARILDLGAGRGGFVRQARLRRFQAWALDRELSVTCVWASAGVPGIVADAFAPAFADCSFDVVRMKELIEHVGEPHIT